jgi:hypothetical protein
LLDRAGTPTRVDRPEEADGRIWFSAPTRFVVTPGATLLVRSSASLELLRASELHVLPGATLRLEPGARVQLDRSSRIVLHGDAVLDLPAEERQRLEKRGRVERR